MFGFHPEKSWQLAVGNLTNEKCACDKWVCTPWLTKMSIPGWGFIHTSHFPVEDLPQMSCTWTYYWTLSPHPHLDLTTEVLSSCGWGHVLLPGIVVPGIREWFQQVHQSNPWTCVSRRSIPLVRLREGWTEGDLRITASWKSPWRNEVALVPLRTPLLGFQTPITQFISERDPQCHGMFQWQIYSWGCPSWNRRHIFIKKSCYQDGSKQE